jgi:hypothetical protein
MTSSGALSYLSLILMPSKKSKSKGFIDKPPPGGTGTSAVSSEEEVVPEKDLISLNEPERVELGDFTAVWQHLSIQPTPEDPTPNTDSADDDSTPVSRKQFIQKTTIVEQSVTIKSKHKNIPDVQPSASSTLLADDKKSKQASKKTKKSKSKPAMTYSSPEDDIDDENLSSYEDKRNLYGPRRKSFLYVPPTFAPTTVSPKLRTVVPAAPPATDRRRNLVQKLVTKHPSEIDRILLPQSNFSAPSTYISSLATLQSPDIHIFIDNSNILIGFFEAYKLKHKISDPFFRAPKFDFHAFTTIIERGRPVSRKILVGSNPLTQPVALAQDLGYEVSILERVVDTSKRTALGNPYSSDSATRTPQREKKKEQAVDEILHLKILECLLDVEKPATIVLATGDAAPAEFSREGGFLKCIQRALKRGWHVELVCWRKSMSRLWREKVFRVEWSDTFTVVELDDYVDELVLE